MRHYFIDTLKFFFVPCLRRSSTLYAKRREACNMTLQASIYAEFPLTFTSPPVSTIAAGCGSAEGYPRSSKQVRRSSFISSDRGSSDIPYPYDPSDPQTSYARPSAWTNSHYASDNRRHTTPSRHRSRHSHRRALPAGCRPRRLAGR